LYWGAYSWSIPPVCPLSFPDTSKVAKECGGTIKNSTTCCKAMLSYVAHLQKQSFITNLQALNCASFLGAKLQKMNVSTNVYSSCQITLKDFSLQGKLFKNYQLIMHKGHIIFWLCITWHWRLNWWNIYLSSQQLCLHACPLLDSQTVGSQGKLIFSSFLLLCSNAPIFFSWHAMLWPSWGWIPCFLATFN